MRIVLMTAIVIGLSIPRISYGDGRALPPGYVRRSHGHICGYLAGKWLPGSMRSGLFSSFAEQLQQLRAQLAAAPRARRAKLRQRISALQLRSSESRAALCRKIRGAPKLLSSLLQIPPVQRMLAARPESAALRALSDLPPTAVEIPILGPPNIFWRPGFIASLGSNMTPEQCGEYLGGLGEGSSAGFSFCLGLEATTGAFAPLSRSATNMCYFRQSLTQANVEAGAVKIIRGSVPANGIGEVFAVPAGDANRIIEVRLKNEAAGDETDFIRLYSAANAGQDAMYRFDAWRCYPGNDLALSYQQSTIKNDRGYSSRVAGKDDIADYDATLQAQLISDTDGVLLFDPDHPRKLSVATRLKELQTDTSKYEIEVGSDNLFRTKLYTSMASPAAQIFAKGYGLGAFSGTGLEDFRTLHAVLKDEISVLGFTISALQSGITWNSGYYAATQDDPLLPYLDEVNLSTDPYFAELEPVNVDMSAFRCDTASDITVEIDLANAALAGAAAACDAQVFSGVAFCQEDPVLYPLNITYLRSCGFN